MNKERIIEEIQRTAKENGGYPLGKQQFSQETGIKQYDWLGRYWARWNDAIAEAGLSPNKLQSAIDEKILFEKYIDLIRELGHLPVEGELRLKKRRDDTFPSSRTYSSRFASKLDLINKLDAYCAERDDCKDISQLFKDYLTNNPVTSEEDENLKEKLGYVYLLKMGRSYKIGKTFNPIRREGEIVLQLPEKSEPIHYIETDDPSGIEKYWHTRFAEKRKEGEWFVLTPADIRAFKRWRRIY
jgi:hypothetical protein